MHAPVMPEPTYSLDGAATGSVHVLGIGGCTVTLRGTKCVGEERSKVAVKYTTIPFEDLDSLLRAQVQGMIKLKQYVDTRTAPSACSTASRLLRSPPYDIIADTVVLPEAARVFGDGRICIMVAVQRQILTLKNDHGNAFPLPAATESAPPFAQANSALDGAFPDVSAAALYRVLLTASQLSAIRSTFMNGGQQPDFVMNTCLNGSLSLRVEDHTVACQDLRQVILRLVAVAVACRSAGVHLMDIQLNNLMLEQRLGQVKALQLMDSGMLVAMDARIDKVMQVPACLSPVPAQSALDCTGGDNWERGLTFAIGALLSSCAALRKSFAEYIAAKRTKAAVHVCPPLMAENDEYACAADINTVIRSTTHSASGGILISELLALPWMQDGGREAFESAGIKFASRDDSEIATEAIAASSFPAASAITLSLSPDASTHMAAVQPGKRPRSPSAGTECTDSPHEWKKPFLEQS